MLKGSHGSITLFKALSCKYLKLMNKKSIKNLIINGNVIKNN